MDATQQTPGMLLGYDQQSMPAPEVVTKEEETIPESRLALVKQWQEKIHKAKKRYSADFDRMRKNMDFVYGLQHEGQKTLIYPKNVVNLTLRSVNQGVASLYAKDPKVSAKRRPRFDFAIWDGDKQTIDNAVVQASQMQMMGVNPPPDVMALIQDYQEGKAQQKLMDKVGKTLEMVYQYQTDTLTPSYKTQMKQLVRRVRVCGVGYIKVLFCRNYETQTPSQQPTLDPTERVKVAQRILERLSSGELEESSPEIETLKNLTASMGVTPLDSEVTRVKERLDFEFPQATSIIPDPSTRALKGWIGTHWIVEEFCYSLEFVNAFYEKDIKAGDLKGFDRAGEPIPITAPQGEQEKGKQKVKVWLVRDIDSKTEFTLLEGYKDYLMAPEPVDSIDSFWNIFPMTFNDVEVEEGCDATVFPPSDVDGLRSTQRDVNDMRNKARRHRRANAPRYLYPDGSIDEEDLDRLEAADDQGFVKLKSLAPGAEPGKIVQALATVEMTESLYDTSPQIHDMLLVTGQQEANIGPAQPNVTATVGSIAEQSRQNVTSSDSDGFDDCLTATAKFGGKLLMREMSSETVREITGNGAWPQQDKETFLNEIELEIVAGSSGRPNKAIEINDWAKLVPLLIQTVTLPPQAQPTMQAIIKKTIEIQDDRLDASDFFPLPVPMLPPTASESGQDQPPPGQGAQGKRPNSPPRKDATNNGQQQMHPAPSGGM